MSFTHGADNLTIPRGRMYFSPFTAGTTTLASKGRVYMGNTPGASLTGDSQKLDHYGADAAVRQKDKSVTTQVDYKGSITTDNISKENLALFFFGTASVLSEAGATGQTEVLGAVAADASVLVGVGATRPQGARNLANVVVKDGVTVKTLGTHYEVDAANGMVHALVAFAAMEVDYDITAHTRDLVVTSGTKVAGELILVLDNSEGDNGTYYMPYVTMSPSGDLALKGDGTAWQELKLELEVLKLAGKAAVYRDGSPIV